MPLQLRSKSSKNLMIAIRICIFVAQDQVNPANTIENLVNSTNCIENYPSINLTYPQTRIFIKRKLKPKPSEHMTDSLRECRFKIKVKKVSSFVIFICHLL